MSGLTSCAFSVCKVTYRARDTLVMAVDRHSAIDGMLSKIVMPFEGDSAMFLVLL